MKGSKGFPNAVNFSHWLVDQSKVEGCVAVDATCGNGHDSVYLAKRVGSDGLVIGFDIQIEAIMATRLRLEHEGMAERVKLIHDSHAHLTTHLGGLEPSVVVFNLGYLPGGDKTCITQTKSTLQSLGQALEVLKPRGMIVITLYPGHAGGHEEAKAVESQLERLPQEKFDVIRYSHINQQNNPPYVIAVMKHPTPQNENR